MKKNVSKISVGLTVAMPLLVLLLFFFRSQIIELKKFFPECYFYSITGYLCPACGNTRSIISLLHGNIFLSLGYNITPIVLLLLSISFYIELVANTFRKKVHIIPRKYCFLIFLLSFMILYYIIRNFFPLITLCK